MKDTMYTIMTKDNSRYTFHNIDSMILWMKDYHDIGIISIEHHDEEKEHDETKDHMDHHDTKKDYNFYLLLFIIMIILITP